jgi:hypothetical protein
MAGYGYYDEEEATGTGLLTGGEEEGGLMTGAGAKTRYKYIYKRVRHPERGTFYPKRGPMTLEYASKLVFNRNLSTKNRWLDFANNDPELKKRREAVAQRMRELAAEYRSKLPAAEREKLERRKKPRSKASRLREAQERVEQFKKQYPNPRSALPVLRQYVPDMRSARIFLRAVYGLTKDEALELLPKRGRMKRKYIPQTFGEYREEVEVPTQPPKQPPKQPPPQTKTKKL